VRVLLGAQAVLVGGENIVGAGLGTVWRELDTGGVTFIKSRLSPRAAISLLHRAVGGVHVRKLLCIVFCLCISSIQRSERIFPLNDVSNIIVPVQCVCRPYTLHNTHLNEKSPTVCGVCSLRGSWKGRH
jgi:hypothetical protein